MFGYSAGADIATHWLVQHGNDPSAPSPNDLSFVLIGNSDHPDGGGLPHLVRPRLRHPNRHQIQGDGNRPTVRRLGGLAVRLPQLAGRRERARGQSLLHPNYLAVDMNAPDNVVTHKGNTTTILVPTQNLPLLQPLRDLGLNDLADKLNAPLKRIVDWAYTRPGPTPTSQVSLPAQPAPSTATIDDDCRPCVDERPSVERFRACHHRGGGAR